MSALEQRVKVLVGTLAKVHPDRISSSADIRKLGIDSLMALELVANLERAFKVHIPEGKIRGITRIDHIVKVICTLQQGQEKRKPGLRTAKARLR